MSTYLGFYCRECKEGWYVYNEDPDVGILGVRMKCPNNNSHYMFANSWPKESGDPSPVVSAKELFKQSMGLGSDSQRACSPRILRHILLGSNIVDMELEESPGDPNRSITNSFTVNSGGSIFKVYMATSTKGPTIYKLEKDNDGSDI